LLSAAACSKQHPGGARGLAILAHVPADTPYVIASLEPLSREYLESYFARERGRMDQALAKLRQVAEGSDIVRFILALADETNGVRTPADLERVGLNPYAHSVIYGLGFLPALRVEVRDAVAVDALIGRAAAKAGLKLPRETHRGRPYYAFRPSASWTILVALERGELVAAGAPTALATRILDLLRGDVSVGPAIAVSTLEKVAAENGYTRSIVGYLDLRRVAAMLVDAKGLTREALDALGAPVLPPSCKDELAAVAALSPRWSGGVTELAAKRAAGTFTMELAPLLARELTELRVPVPGVGARLGSGVLSFGAAIDVGKLIALLRRGAGIVALVPYKCPALGFVNQAAGELARELSGPLPPWLAELRGFAATLSSVEHGAAVPDIKGFGLLAASDPIQLIDMAKRAVPQLAGLEIPPDGRPVPIPSGLLPLMTGHVAMKGQLLGLSLGAGSELELVKLMSTRPESNMPIFHLAMDADKLRAVLKGFGGMFGGDDASFGEGVLYTVVDLTERGLVWKFEQVSTSPTP
jgi:hypothetical protein